MNLLYFLSLILIFFVSFSKSQHVFISNDGYDFKDTLYSNTVYSEFNNCKNCKHFYTANFVTNDKIFFEVFVPPSETDVITVVKIIGPDNTVNFDKYILDDIYLCAKKKIYEIDAISQTNTSVILQIVSNSPHAHYAVRIGKNDNVGILDYTIKFPYVTQSLRLWNNTFLFFVFYLILSVIYFFTWPLKRYKSYVIFPKLAIIGYMSWILDTFYQYFFIVQYTSSFDFITFIFHVFPNVLFIFLLVYVYDKTTNKEMWLLGICIVSFLYGGGGFYVSSVSLLISYIGLIAMKNKNEGKDKKVLLCVNVKV